MDWKDYYDSDKGNSVIEIILGTDAFQKQIKSNILDYLEQMNKLQMMYYKDISVKQDKIDKGIIDDNEPDLTEEDCDRLYAMNLDINIKQTEGWEDNHKDLKPLFDPNLEDELNKGDE